MSAIFRHPGVLVVSTLLIVTLIVTAVSILVQITQNIGQL